MLRIDEVKLFDGTITKIKYSYDDNVPAEKLVIYLNGSGPNTYDDKRKIQNDRIFSYHDYIRKEFLKRGVAYCSYNTRGVDVGENEPLFDKINNEQYKKYTPTNSVKDIETIINYLVRKPFFKNSKIILLGWSEGTVLAPLVALNDSVRVDILLLAGYCNDNLEDTVNWQLSGHSSMVLLQPFFDEDKKGFIIEKDFEEDKFKKREKFFGKMSFQQLDVNKDGKIDYKDFAILQGSLREEIFKAIKANDDEWLRKYYGFKGLVLTSGWFKDHFNLKPNKEVLPLLNIPIFIFHGYQDANCPVKYAIEIKKKFSQLHKTNLTVNLFEGHDHDLNFINWVEKNEMSQGFKAIFDTVDNI